MIIGPGDSVGLTSAINNSTDKLIYIQGTYQINSAIASTRFISKVRGRKIIGIGDTAKIVFNNIPNGSLLNPIVCFDLQSKARIYNIKFEFIPNPSLSTNINIIGIKFKRILSQQYESVGIGSLYSDLPSIDVGISSIRLSGPTINEKIVSLSSLSVTRYYFEIRNPSGASPKETYSFYTLVESESADNSYTWTIDDGEDEADMDSSLSGCTLSFKSNIGLSTYSNRSIVGIDYHGRNLSCDTCIFNNFGTSIRIQFPLTDTLTSPGSKINPYQSGYYGHRKCSIARNIFNTSFNSITLTGYVTIRGMLVFNNTINNGKLLFCDGSGGVKSSLITQNVVNNNIQDINLKSTIQIANGLFTDNIISNNTFTGPIESSVSIATTTNYNNLVSNNIFKNNTKNAFLIKKPDSICITNNTFDNITSPNLIVIREGSKNLNISFNTLTGINTSNFLNLRVNANVTHSRVVITKNRLRSSSNVKVLSTSPDESYIIGPSFVQDNF